MKNKLKKLLIALALGAGMTLPASANEYPKLLQPIGVNFVNGQGAGLKYDLAHVTFADLNGTPVGVEFAPGIETDPNKGFRVSENLGAYVFVGPLHAGVTKTFSRGFNLSQPMKFSVAFDIFSPSM